MENEKAVVYMVAGMSSRFGGRIKQFAEVGENGETLMEISMQQALRAGASKIIFVVGQKTEKLFKEKFGEEYEGVPVVYAMQLFDEAERDKPWGTADALCAARDVIDCGFVVCNGDDLYGESSFKDLFDCLDTGDEGTVGFQLGKVIPDEGGVNRAIFTEEKGYVKNLIETFDIERSKLGERGLTEESLCSMNIFGLHPEVLEMLDKKLAEFKGANRGDRKAECFLPQEISDLIVEGKIKMRLIPARAKWIGITNPGDEVAVREFLKDDKNK
ncbi:MAG: sugar phosphate nucleotidyltransferase [Nanoarchaeota archaeon]